MDNYAIIKHCNKSMEQMDLSNSKPPVTLQDLQKLLEVLTSTDDSDTHVKIFSILAVTIISRTNFNDIIITRNGIYNKIRDVLIQQMPTKITITLNFVSSMLYIDDEEGPTRKKSLVLYAQNMIRKSGCLLAMCYLFTSPMMYQETWSALCRSIAESCKQSHENQTYCSHLVAKIVKKCAQGDTEVILTLKSLLDNNPRNIQLFLECHGISIFNRELLQNDNCLHLLDMLVQNITTETLKLLYKQVFEHLHYFKTSHSASTRVGQWATLIMYHLNTRVKALKEDERSYFQSQDRNVNKTSNISCGTLLKPHCDDTARLLQNVITEMYQYNANIAKNNPALRNANALSLIDKTTKCTNENSDFFMGTSGPSERIIKNQFKPISKVSNNDSNNDLTFSFLLKPHLQDSLINVNYNAHNASELHKSQAHESTLSRHLPKQTNRFESNKSVNNTTHLNRTHIPNNKLSNQMYDSNTMDFNPIFVSTPKHKHSRSTNLTKSLRMYRYNPNIIKKLNNFKEEYKGIRKQPKDTETSQTNSIRQRSMSSRLFDAINDSCTTLVKTVKNIFKSKISKKDVNKKANKVDDSCSYSFTEYMRQRDAALSDERTKNTSAISESRYAENCKTCNDTLQLKRKIISDECLRDTIRKLKVGINLYGCDFKKISRTMWPRENYMTPEILYNLYRKIIIK